MLHEERGGAEEVKEKNACHILSAQRDKRRMRCARRWIYACRCKQNRFDNSARLNNKEHNKVRIHNEGVGRDGLFSHFRDRLITLHYKLIKLITREAFHQVVRKRRRSEEL